MAAALTVAVSTIGAIALPSAGAATPPFTQCPAVGADSSCGLLITVDANGSVSIAGDTTQGPYDAAEDTLVGVQNNASGFVSSISLSGSNIFGFDNDGICTLPFAGNGYCSSLPSGSSGYEGPGTSFTVASPNSGTVNFTGGGLAPSSSTYFSLEGAPTPGSITLVPVLVATPVSVSTVEGAALSNQTVATFTTGNPSTTAAGYAASINWGDASPLVAGVISGPAGGPFSVSGPHTYAEEGNYTVTVNVTDLSLPANTGTALSSAAVADAAITGTGHAFTATTGASTGAVTVATFTDADPGAVATDFSATINWGDSSSSAGAVTGPSGGVFAVAGTHTYATHGTFPVTVLVTDAGGSSTSPTTTASVDDAVITCPAGQSCSGTATVPNSMAVTVSGTSTTNAVLFVQIGQDALNCGDPFFHAPEVTTLTETGFNSSAGKVVTLDINKSVVGKKLFLLFQVCYSGTTPFTDFFGRKNVTTGVLPYCLLVRNKAPCVVSTIKNSVGDVIEKFDVPGGDPRFH